MKGCIQGVIKDGIFEWMHRYFIKTPRLIKKYFSRYVWEMPAAGKAVYLTFDDGPHPAITPWVLDELKRWNAKATFFCIGQNVLLYPEIYNRTETEGHTTGNHTFNHLNGWKVPFDKYIADIEKAASVIRSSLFRPPYGRICYRHLKPLKKIMGTEVQVIMWDVLSADFDNSFSKERCLENVLKNVKDGSIIVFHDSEKAYDNLGYVLPLVLQKLKADGYMFLPLENKARTGFK